jgi:hypothetical protein
MFIDLALTIDAFVNHIDETLGPEIALSDFAGSAALLDNAVYGMATLVGDAVVVRQLCATLCIFLMRARYIAAMLFGIASIL